MVEAAPDVVYHLAAFTHVGQSWTDPVEVLRVNALGTLHVLEAARSCPQPPRVLLTSSAEVYGAVPEDLLPVTEDAPLAPVTPYAASKVAAEYLGVQAHLAYGLPGPPDPALQPRGPGPVLGLRRLGAGRSGSSRRAAAGPRASWWGT